MTVEATTTEGAAEDRTVFSRPPRLRPTSVRTRITAVVALLAGLALTGAGLAVYLVQSNRLDDQANSAISVEMAEFSRLEAAGIDPETGKAFTDSTDLMRAALESNVPQDNVVLIAFWNGRAQLGQGADSSRLSEYPPFLTSVRSRLSQGGAFRLDTPLGPALVAVQAVHGSAQPGGLAVAYLLRPQHAALRSLMQTYTVVALVALALVTAGAWVVSSRLLRPLHELRETAREISDTDLTRRLDTSGNDDLTELAETFNAMLDRLESSFTANRQFLDDAGHELRTPITIIRGHLELIDADNPRDVRATRDLVLDEIDRMTRMVDDLIVLSGADQPDFITIRPIDAKELTLDVLGKARALGERTWMVDSCSDATVLADPQRITQALLQLCKNSFAHTQRDDEIALGFRTEPARAYWWVRDTGTGISFDDTQRVFERFQRGERDPGSDGSGLGLAIVSAIMHAHGGSVDLESAVGLGSIFTLTIPRGATP
jgi:two-component system, OmpR family, sensor kinase